MNKYQNEIWKDIEGYEGLYQISNMGRIKSLPRNTTKGGIIKTGYLPSGYENAPLCKNGKRKNNLVHRLVAKAFVKNPYNYQEINHKDRNPANNMFSNLEWCTHKDNIRYSKARKVKSIDEDGNETFFNSIYETRLYGYNYGDVNRCCKDGNRHKGLRWEYVK